jgi:hypothetical protein
MKQIRETLRLRFEVGIESSRKIAAAVGAGKTTISEYLREAVRLGITSFDQVRDLNESELEQIFETSKANRRKGLISSEEHLSLQRTLPDFAHMHDELRRPGVTLMLLWEEYREQHPKGYSYSQYREYYDRWKRKLALVMRQTHSPGEKAFTDFSGDGFEITDRKTGAKTKAELFVATLGASSYTFACAVASQQLPDWIECHRKFFEWLGGVPLIVVPDNLKSGVKEPNRYEPEINYTYKRKRSLY